jgi:hypothetical protein
LSDNVSRGQQAAEEVARRWIATMQSMADQILRQQQTFQQMMQDQMSSYVQLLNTPPFYVSQQPQEESHRAGLPSSLGAVDAAGPTTAADLPGDVPAVDGAGRRPTAGLPAGGPAVFDRLHGPLQTS